MNQEKTKGRIAFRSAGSLSPIDVVSIDKDKRLIRLIQSKSDNLPESEKKRILNMQWDLHGQYTVTFEVI